LHAELEAEGVKVHETVQKLYDDLLPKDKKTVLHKLWKLARIEKESAEEQRKIFKKMATDYETLFDWEEGDDPGWIV
jgi:hypothetical protein